MIQVHAIVRTAAACHTHSIWQPYSTRANLNPIIFTLLDSIELVMNAITDRLSLKGTQLTTLVVFLSPDLPNELLANELAQKIEKAPQLFDQSPVVVDLSEYQDQAHLDTLAEALTILRSHKLQPIGCCETNSVTAQMAQQLQLPILSNLGKQRTELFSKSSIQEEVAPAPMPVKVINQTVRSGQLIYAEGCDLVVNANVNKGGEVLADGHIHIYGALKGKALAGAKQNPNAHIFCQSLEAELISIAGHFLVGDQFEERKKQGTTQVFLSDEQLMIRSLSK